MRKWTVIAIAALVLAAGCAQIEPKTGTRVTITFPPGKSLSRERLVSISQYLKTKGELVLGVPRPRVDDVRDHYLILLLPGGKIPKSRVEKLIAPSSIELYQLTSVATAKAPNRRWRVKVPTSVKGPYLFLGPNSQRIDSQNDAKSLMTDVVGPQSKPILTGQDILPNAFAQQGRNGWSVQVQFNKRGARVFSDFTKRNSGEYLAVFYNGRLVSAPIVQGAIPGGTAVITGFASSDQARRAVADLNAGTLPAAIKITCVDYY